MKLKKINLTIGMIFTILTIFSSCNSQGNINNPQTLIIQESNSGEKTKLLLNCNERLLNYLMFAF
jgi:hypothetical protein